jgi:hypothetical protein
MVTQLALVVRGARAATPGEWIPLSIQACVPHISPAVIWRSRTAKYLVNEVLVGACSIVIRNS